MKNTTISVCKELGEKVPANTQIEFIVSHSGGYAISTALELAGRGIRQTSDGQDHARGLKSYHVTEKAMQKLEASYKCAYLETL